MSTVLSSDKDGPTNAIESANYGSRKLIKPRASFRGEEAATGIYRITDAALVRERDSLLGPGPPRARCGVVTTATSAILPRYRPGKS